jgi:predicted TPR repeat methyltransferase
VTVRRERERPEERRRSVTRETSEQGSAADRREALAAAILLLRGGRLGDAESAYRQVLAKDPDDPDALHFLGLICHQRGRGADAVDLIRRAIAVAPGYADAHNNLGNVLKMLDRLEEAADAYRRALELRPDDASMQNNLGIALRWLGRVDEAIALHRQAIGRAPRFAAAHFSLGQALRERGDLEGAIAAFSQGIALEPAHVSAYQSLSRALHLAGRDAEAADVFARWLDREPGHPVALHMLAACSGRDVPRRAPDAYVRAVFDALAQGFDEHLGHLGYRAPQLVADALAADAGPPRGELEVVDAGCGTGLCGPLLRPYARRLVGVDLSAAMLVRAGNRGVYDELVGAELTAYLDAHPETFDLVTSADTLVYFGDLQEVLGAATRALRPGGRLVFTVESAEVDGAAPGGGYRLNPHGRFSHSAPYLRRQIAATGLALGSIDVATLRNEGGRPVAGYVVSAGMP